MKQLVKKFIPNQVIDKMKSVRNTLVDIYALKSYSQEGEDMILRRLFENKPSGFYVDVGAHHPKRFSNTYLFYKRGWHGINIDAMPQSMKIFRKVRPRDINIECAISDKVESLTYYEFNEPALNGFSKELSEQRDGLKDYYIVNQYEITTKTLNTILVENYAPKDFDFLTIDVEGLDFKVLKSLDFTIFKPKIVMIEVLENSFSELEDHEITIYLKKFGYKIFAKSVNTVFFIQADDTKNV